MFFAVTSKGVGADHKRALAELFEGNTVVQTAR